ncbi:S41 family peptidase (plasmid) [Streptomyces sp. BI20]|uniref:S41 family peptidase n=1 Tax=Streptomyces sp. BI20 TaxID=3403460 RepID=UPI003C736778
MPSPTPARPRPTAGDLPYAAHPHLHGNHLVFTADGHVWHAPLTGGTAHRVTDGAPGKVGHPRISPDGRLLAWTWDRDGAPEAYLAPLDGSAPARRLTHLGHPRTRVAGWTPDGELLVLSAQHGVSPLDTRAWTLPPTGGAPRPLPYGPVGDLAAGPDGRTVLRTVTMFPANAHWKGYRGGAAGRLWITDPTLHPADGPHRPGFRPLVPEGHGGPYPTGLEHPVWWADPEGPRVGFLSEADGRSRLWSCRPDGTDPRPHTPTDAHPDTGARDAAGDGTRVVYQSAGEIWLLPDAEEGTRPVRVDLRLPGPRPGRAPHRVSAAHPSTTVGAGPPGTVGVLEVRGTVHLLTDPDAPAHAVAGRPGVRRRLPAALGDTGRELIWVSDTAGPDALEIAPAPGPHPTRSPAPAPSPRVLAAGRLGRVLELRPAPDGRTAAVAAHDGRLLLVDTTTGTVTEVTHSAHEEVTGLAYSPDSSWLAWSHPGPAGLRRIRILRIADATPGRTPEVIDATDGRFRDLAPAFTPDGAHLAFLSDRVFDPEYQTHILGLALVDCHRPHLLTLTAHTPSPLLTPLPRTEPPAPGPPRTDVDTTDLHQRIVPFPVPGATYTALDRTADGLLWTRAPLTGTTGDRWAPAGPPPRPVLEHWHADTRTVTVRHEGLDAFTVTDAGRAVLIRDGAALTLLPLTPPPARPAEPRCFEPRPVDLARTETTVDPPAEWAASHAEDERLMRDNVWHPDLPTLGTGRPGPDPGPWARRRHLLDRIGTPEEFLDLLWDTHGDLRTSHAYAWPRPTPHHGPRAGLLGADLAPDADGHWRILRIVPGDSSVPAARSPLAAPGTGLRAGDALLRIDGRPVDPAAGPAPLLWGTAERPVELTVRPADAGPERTVTVTPLASETALRGQDLIRTRRARVHTAAPGRLGYVHVPDMLATGWATLHRDLRAETTADALLVDLRGNSGGHLAPHVLELLARTPLGWHARRGATPLPMPDPAPRGPLVFLADEFCGSDGDNAVAMIRARALGPVVGARTWGGVRGMEIAHTLVDGTRLVHPRGAFWTEHGGWELENRGVEPDIEIVTTPHERAAGADPALDRAIALALHTLAHTPPHTPPPLPPPSPRHP